MALDTILKPGIRPHQPWQTKSIQYQGNPIISEVLSTPVTPLPGEGQLPRTTTGTTTPSYFNSKRNGPAVIVNIRRLTGSAPFSVDLEYSTDEGDSWFVKESFTSEVLTSFQSVDWNTMWRLAAKTLGDANSLQAELRQ